jgi:hypothetical protein
MITVKVNTYVKCNTGHEGVLEWIMDSEEEILRGWGPSYGMVDGIPCNLHNCIPWTPYMPSVPTLTIEMVLAGNTHNYNSTEVMAVLQKEEYTHLGWLNAGITPPALNDWTQAYSNWSGSTTIMVSPSTRLIYSVDMGD